MIKVYHNRRFIEYDMGSHFIDSTNLTLVAVVETDDLDRAFELTQHLDQSWQLNPGITFSEPTARSSSVGDVLVWLGMAYVIEGIGFRPLRHLDIRDLPKAEGF